jgi:nonsense-mediated mRNA decay protein 3
MKQSSKNAGMKDSRQLYRMTYLIRLPAYQKGDYLLFDNKVYYISSLHGYTIHVLELSTWTKKIFTGQDLQDVRVLGGKDLVKEMILVSQTPAEVQLMHPTSYEILHVRKPEPVQFVGEKIKTICVEDQLFLLPEKTIRSK